MNRLLRGARWLMGTQWPMYATLVLGSNILGAVAIMTFVVFFLPMPEIKDFTSDVPHLALIGVLYVSFAVLIGISVTLLLFRPVLDWQRNPEAHDPNMVRNLVLRIPIYQAAVAGLVWIIGIVLAIIIAAQSSGSLGLVVGVSTTLAGLLVVLLTYLQAERLVRPVAAQGGARRFEDSTLEPPIKYRLIYT
ncbi:MAG: adenylate/guanylate cyclase domain-containing protein, partial [Corynebacterium striatum]|nr:adenylate/guanylate cyclase domain-containing protein [Corynebacterium striatum]